MRCAGIVTLFVILSVSEIVSAAGGGSSSGGSSGGGSSSGGSRGGSTSSGSRGGSSSGGSKFFHNPSDIIQTSVLIPTGSSSGSRGGSSSPGSQPGGGSSGSGASNFGGEEYYTPLGAGYNLALEQAQQAFGPLELSFNTTNTTSGSPFIEKVVEVILFSPTCTPASSEEGVSVPKSIYQACTSKDIGCESTLCHNKYTHL